MSYQTPPPPTPDYSDEEMEALWALDRAEEIYAEARPEIDIHTDATATDWLREELGRGKLAGIFRRVDMLI
jgi:hypothetical protein